MQSILSILILAGIVLAVLVVIGIIFARLYRRATKETAYVRTGLRGQKVIMDGGAIVLPIFHGTIPVNMNTLKLEVERRQRESLITHDRMRVDVMAAFFVRVKQTEESVSTAAQTLGQRTMDPNALKALVEDKFVDALRSTAATMTMHELQDKRREFVQAVQNAVAEDLEKNGLELEAVSLTRLDQTDKQFFNPDNAFDAEGLTRLTEETQARRKQRNDIEQDTEVQVRAKNLEAERQRLDIEKQQEFATLSQQREIASTRAEQAALTATQEAQRHLESEGSRIESERQVNQRRIEADRTIREAEIAKNLNLQSSQIEADRKTKVQQAMQHKEIEIANQDAKIAISTKSREQSEADAAANQALSEAVKAEELVKTAREVAVAERDKQIQLIDAAKGAEQQALTIRVAALAERDAAIHKAEATKLTADADKAAALARAEGERALNEALNMLSAAQIDLKVRLQLLEQLPKILAEAVKPMEKIESIRMFQVNGLSNLGGQGQVTDGTAHPAQGGSLPDQVMNSALNYQIAKPLIDAIMQDAGLGNGSLTGIAQQLAAMNQHAVQPQPVTTDTTSH